MPKTDQTAKKLNKSHPLLGVGTQSFVYFRSENKVTTIRNLKILKFLLNIRNLHQKFH